MAGHPILAEIRNARSHSDQISSLRLLKDEIVGHVQRKERWVEQGVLEVIVNLLRGVQLSAKQNGKEPRTHIALSKKLSEVELVRLQALQILASFANGGPPFLAPIYRVGAVPVLLAHISPFENPPQVSLAALRVLNNLADAASSAAPEAYSTAFLANTLFAPRHLDTLYSLLVSDSLGRTVQEQKCQIASLVSKLCKEAQDQNALADAGVLDALATLLASFVVARGEVVPGADLLGQSDGLAEFIPHAAPVGLRRAVVLEAISTIIADSRFRACMFVYSPAIMAIFPNAEFSTPTKDAQNAWNMLEKSGLSSLRAKNPGAMEYLMPVVPVSQPKSLASHVAQFPPLGYSLSKEKLALNGRSSSTRFASWDPARFEAASPGGEDIEDAESPLIPWLIHFVRSSEPLERVLAASVLASLFKARFANPEREAAIGMLVVPVLCRLIQEHSKESEIPDLTFIEPDTALNWTILERAPAVLARLVADSEFLQQSAYECGVIKTACKLLKDSYDPLPAQSAPRPWSPTPDRALDRNEGLSTRQMDPPGQLPICTHKIRMRESSLKLIAAMSSFRDEFRKAVVNQEIVPYVVESLSPCPGKPKHTIDRPKADKGADDIAPAVPSGQASAYGNNPDLVIIAACHVLRILGRSISVVRTSLKDHGVAMPVFALLRHNHVEVQIAACSVICNLVTEVSPMRERLIEAGILTVLCEHAHSLNAGLRLNSMWALKHLVGAVDNDLKKKALETLEPGWLIQLICADTEDSALHERMKLERRIADGDEDEDMDAESYDDSSRSWAWPAMYRSSSTGTSRSASQIRQSARMQKAERRLAALRETELNPIRKARNDDLAIQEQGLNFIRNLTVPPSSSGAGNGAGAGVDAPTSVTEMVDYVFSELGQDRLFDILASKLRARVLHPFERRYSAGAKVLYPQAKIIEAVVYTLVHIAASMPRHRQLVIAQTELLKLVGTQFTSGSVSVRRALCNLLKNLVCVEDPNDAQASHQRAQELKRLGFLTKLEGLEHDDAELDIREQARAAVWLMQKGHA